MIVKSKFNDKARFANEQQETPNNKACRTKNQIVNFRTIQHNAIQRSSISVSFVVIQLTLLNCFSIKPSPFKLIAFVGKLDQDSGAHS